MKRLALALFGSLILTTPVLAEDDESHNGIIDQDRRVFGETDMKVWGPVYKRADRTIKVGFGLGIYGGVAMVGGKILMQQCERDCEMDLEGLTKLMRLVDALEDDDDVQNVTTNFEASDEVMTEFSES